MFYSHNFCNHFQFRISSCLNNKLKPTDDEKRERKGANRYNKRTTTTLEHTQQRSIEEKLFVPILCKTQCSLKSCKKMAQLIIMDKRQSSYTTSLTTQLPAETLFETLCFLNAADLGRISCANKLLLIISDEVQNQPYFDTRNGDIAEIIPALLNSSQVCPSVAFVFRGNNFDRTRDIHDYTECLPPKCTIIGCDDVPLFVPPIPFRNSPISQATVTLAHFPDANIHSFNFNEGMKIILMS
jgi:hypothetical protein